MSTSLIACFWDSPWSIAVAAVLMKNQQGVLKFKSSKIPSDIVEVKNLGKFIHRAIISKTRVFETDKSRNVFSPTPTLAAWPLRRHTALKSILLETLFLDQLYDFPLLSLNSLLHLFLKSKFMKKNSFSPRKFHFRSLGNIWPHQRGS